MRLVPLNPSQEPRARPCASPPFPLRIADCGLRPGFTLIEIMIVVAIMGIMLTMGVPLVYRVYHKDSMSKAIVDVQNVCSTARAHAIMQGHMVEVVFHPRANRLEISGSDGGSSASSGSSSMNISSSGSDTSAQLSDRIVFEMLDINLTECKDYESARVRFYPNGTCDELTIVLHDDKNDWRKITTEITTSLTKAEDFVR